MVHVGTTTCDPLRDAESLRRAAAGPLHSRHDVARHRYDSVAAAPEQVTIPVEGTAVRFAAWREAERWWAAATRARTACCSRPVGFPLSRCGWFAWTISSPTSLGGVPTCAHCAARPDTARTYLQLPIPLRMAPFAGLFSGTIPRKGGRCALDHGG